MTQTVVVTGSFDDLRSRQVRFLEEASRFGEVTVLLWGDDLVRQRAGKPPKFAQAEREYFLRAIRFVRHVRVITDWSDADVLPEVPDFQPGIWVVDQRDDNPAKRTYCQNHAVHYHVLRDDALCGFPDPAAGQLSPCLGRKRVIVTGCYDWFHSGHVRFFEEVSTHGDLYVIVGHDANIRLLKGEGHPLLPQEERRYMAGSIRYVTQALISTGEGWLDAEPEILRLKPDIYAVNDDGDKGGKREFCALHGIEYLVLKRIPAPGLPQRTSTNLRGF